MSKSTPEQVEEEVPTAVSKKREIAATVTATGVGIALSLAAQVFIQKISSRVHSAIVPEDADNNE